MATRDTPLSDMIKQASDDGHSYVALAARATAAGLPVSHGHLHDIALKKLDHIPAEARLKGIAQALFADYQLVRFAALIQYLPPPDEESAARLERKFRELDEATRDEREALMDAKLAAERIERAERAIMSADVVAPRRAHRRVA